MPEVIAQAGVRMIEVGTTNRTRIGDYERAIAHEGASVILRVHQSNFRTLGFVEDVPVAGLCELGVPVIDDVGSGALAEGLEALADEPSVRDSVRAGAELVCFSGDKLLGGPQAGILAGRSRAIAAARGRSPAGGARVRRARAARPAHAVRGRGRDGSSRARARARVKELQPRGAICGSGDVPSRHSRLLSSVAAIATSSRLFARHACAVRESPAALASRSSCS